MNVDECKHQDGWCAIEFQNIFISKEGLVETGFLKKNKVLFECNNKGCDKVKTGYVKAKIRFEKVRKPTKIEKIRYRLNELKAICV